VLQLFKAAAEYDGLKLAAKQLQALANMAPEDVSSEEEEDLRLAALAMFEPLADRLIEQGAVELLQTAAQNRWALSMFVE
jgi:hypothetical protein